MNDRKGPANAPGPAPRPGGRGSATSQSAGGGRGTRPDGPYGRSWAFWRQLAEILLLSLLALAGLADVALTYHNLVPAVVFGVLMLALVASVGIMRAMR
jgi:hypothetical protein